MKRALAAAAVTLAALAAAPGAQAAEKAIWGPVTLPGGGSAFPTYTDLGVDTFQYVINFADVAPSRPADIGNPSDPAYRWPAELDRAVAEAAAARINLGLLVTESPGWANGGRSRLHAPDPTSFASFMVAASRRYPAVRRWMIWGEPNRSDRFQPNSANSAEGPRAYARLLDAAYGALKGVSRRNIVIGGMTWTGGDVKPAPFMKLMRLPNGRPPRLDWFGHNPFPFRFPDLGNPTILGGFRDISDLDAFQRQLRRTFGKRTRFWLSEFLVLSDRPSNQFAMSVSRAAQARWLRAAYRIADDLESVAGLGWLSLFDEAERPGSSNWGLLTAGGARKPSYGAYRAARSERFKPAVRAPRRVGRRALARGRLVVRVRARIAGTVTVELRRGGRLVARMRRRVRTARTTRFRIRGRLARRGPHRVIVQAPRASTVSRGVGVR